METTQETGATGFAPPGPGTWLLDAVHVPRPFSRFQAGVHPESLAEGFREGARRYGLLVDTLDWRFVNGFAYFMTLPAPENEIPARFAAAEAALEGKLWRSDMLRWDETVRPASIRAHRALQAANPDQLSDEDLLAHIERCHEHLRRMVTQHHQFNPAAMIPVGDFMAHVSEWTGLPLGEFLALMRGAAPETAGSFPELDRLAAAIRASAEARSVLRSDIPAATILDRLRSLPDGVGAAAADYLDLVGHRLLDSLDTGEPSAIEVPEVLVEGIRRAVDRGSPASSEASAAEIVRVRDRVPAMRRDAFDDLLDEARFISRLRDERGLYSDVWAGGIARRAILAAGRRLAARGSIAEAAHLVEGGYGEIRSLLTGGRGPSADELASRAKYRAGIRASSAPPFLGPPPSPPPSLDGLPPSAARIMRAMGMAIDALFSASQAKSEARVVRGTGASPGSYTGVARLIGGPSEFGRLRSGDVLVTQTTTEAFNIVLPLLGAIVTDTGGLLSHAAIVSREYGIPGVVGCRDATRLITDGARVEVDGTAGEVRLLTP